MGNLKENYNVKKKLPECTLFMNVRFYKKSDSEVKYNTAGRTEIDCFLSFECFVIIIAPAPNHFERRRRLP
jgi:hypothetical protein